MKPDTAAIYVRENFEPADRLAIVLLNKRTNSVIQRIGTAQKIAAPEYQAWLKQQNGRFYEVYISMNALRESAKGRTKSDIGKIRHVYLDLDENADAATKALLSRTGLPKPNYLISSSPGKWQVIWRVQGFGQEQAEDLQKGLAAETGADRAATDCARVLRLPGFYNHKYAQPHLISVESLARAVYRPEQFPRPVPQNRANRSDVEARVRRGWALGALSQSERDWAYAKRALARGDPPGLVAAAIASYRRFDKHNPQYYAELTVRKAAQELRSQEMGTPGEAPERT